MPSAIGEIYDRYREALDYSLEDHEEEQRRALGALREIYGPLLSNFVQSYDWIDEREGPLWSRALQNLTRHYGEGERSLSFAAIDGTCDKKELSEMLIFYGASYAQQGELVVGQDSDRVEYRKWSPREDTSIVAYLPVPLSRMNRFEDEDWLYRADDLDRSSASTLHTSLMQLAEVYVAYRRVTEDDPPKILLLDNSLSSVLLSNDVMHRVRPYDREKKTLGWIDANIPIWNRRFEPADGLVAHAHPMESDLEVPSWRFNALAEGIIARITDFWQGGTGDRDEGRRIPIREIVQEGNFETSEEAIIERIERGAQRYRAFEVEGDEIVPDNRLENGRLKTLRQRWSDLRRLFEFTCEKLFRERRVEALQLQYHPESERRGPRWMDGEDLSFLIGLGLRLLIEKCWQERTLLVGIVKDSASRFFSRNYLSVLGAGDRISIPSSGEPAGSDRLIFEAMPLIDDDLKEPWGSVEFDSIHMTLRALRDVEGNGEPRPIGVRGDVLVPSDGLFLRSLVQMFLKRRPSKDSPLMGHVLFMDRLADPHFDGNRRMQEGVHTRDSVVHPLYQPDCEAENLGQEVAMLVTYLLTKNCFPEAIGQPDPLHRADQGAKALGKRINKLVQQSTERLRRNPLAWSFRDYRSQNN